MAAYYQTAPGLAPSVILRPTERTDNCAMNDDYVKTQVMDIPPELSKDTLNVDDLPADRRGPEAAAKDSPQPVTIKPSFSYLT